MPPRGLFAVRMALIAAAMLAVGSAPVAAKPVERQESSLEAAVDNFIAYLKSETQHATTAAAKYARDNQDVIDQAKSSLARQLDKWGAALSGQKDRLTTLSEDASAMWEALAETAGSAWAKIEGHALDALDWALDWMRSRSQSDQRHEIPV
jgi:HAMP domain-containing protein